MTVSFFYGSAWSNPYVKDSSRTIAPEENCPSNLVLTLTLNQTLTLTGGGVIFLEGNCPDTVKDTVFISQH